MSEVRTLSALIAEAGFKLRWFDLGRRVQVMTQGEADRFETGCTPWPHCYLRHAWIGLLLWPEEGGEPAVWFLHLPLDEEGKLQLPVRDGFLRRLLQQLQEDNNRDPAAQLQTALDQSGLVYTPAPERMASFHAKAQLLLNRPPSSHYTAVLDYCREPKNHAWNQLGLQGIADLAVRWHEHSELLRQQMAQLAPAVFISLCQCLESEAIDRPLAAQIVARAKMAMASDNADWNQVAAAVRGISHSEANELRREFLRELLHSSARQQGEILSAIGSRCPQDLQDAGIARPWLTALAEGQEQQIFNLLLGDLLFLPNVRAVLLEIMRDPARPESLAQAFGNFLRGPAPTH